MTSQKPYLVRAIYEWLLDNQLTPYLLANTTVDGVQVPHEYINDIKHSYKSANCYINTIIITPQESSNENVSN